MKKYDEGIEGKFEQRDKEIAKIREVQQSKVLGNRRGDEEALEARINTQINAIREELASLKETFGSLPKPDIS